MNDDRYLDEEDEPLTYLTTTPGTQMSWSVKVRKRPCWRCRTYKRRRPHWNCWLRNVKLEMRWNDARNNQQ